MLNVAAAIILKDNKVLIARRRKGKSLEGYYEFPGGKVEEGETDRDCLKRELMEEMQIKIEVLDYVGESVYDLGTKVISLKGYTAHILQGEIKLIDHDVYKWVKLKDIHKFKLAPADVPLIKLYIQEIK